MKLIDAIIERIRIWIEKKKAKEKEDGLLKKYGAITFCECGHIHQEDCNAEEVEYGRYCYKCSNCGVERCFEYGIAPVPLLCDREGNILE